MEAGQPHAKGLGAAREPTEGEFEAVSRQVSRRPGTTDRAQLAPAWQLLGPSARPNAGSTSLLESMWG